MNLGIDEALLPNGLKVLTVERHTAPVVSVWAWYRVGSRNERRGTTGASHWVEHMLFKGGREFGKGEIFKQAAKHGGVNNGFTSHDYTAYYETLPAEAMDLGLRIEADRMAHALFDPAEVESERTVILSEREGAENHPSFLLGEELDATAFREHPYRWTVLGFKDDLRSMTREDLYQHYRTYYAPNNAFLVVVGHIDRPQVLDRIAELYGSIPRGAQPPAVRAVEPPQLTERRVTLRLHGGAALVRAAYHTPAWTHADAYPLHLAAAVLSGAGALGMGGAVGGSTSRLHRALVRSELASDTYASGSASVDPSLFEVGATVREGVDAARVEATLLAELDRLRQEPPSAEEMEKARTQTRASFAYSWDGITSIGGITGTVEAIDSHRTLETCLDRIDAVTRDDVQRVAASYFTESNRTIGRFIPTQT